VVVEVSTVEDVVVWTAVASVVDDEEDDVVAPTVVVVSASVEQAPLTIDTAIPAASNTRDLISSPPRECVLSLERRPG